MPSLHLLLAALAMVPTIAQAQFPSLPKSLPGLPKVGSMSAGNVAGVLQYCATNQLLGGANPQSLVSGLTAKPGASTSSADYKAGAAGQILGGKQPFSLGSLQGDLKSQACTMVMKQAGQLL